MLNEDYKLEETRLDFIRNLVHFKKKLTMEEFTKPSNIVSTNYINVSYH